MDRRRVPHSLGNCCLLTNANGRGTVFCCTCWQSHLVSMDSASKHPCSHWWTSLKSVDHKTKQKDMNLDKGFVGKMEVDWDWRDIRETVTKMHHIHEWNFQRIILITNICWWRFQMRGLVFAHCFLPLGPSISIYLSKTKGLILKIPFIGH